MAFAVCIFIAALSAAVRGIDTCDSFADVFFDDTAGSCGEDAVPLSADCLCAAAYFSHMEEG